MKYKHIAKAIYGEQRRPKFALGDYVSIYGTGMNGTVDHIGEFDVDLGQFRYKVTDDDNNRKTWNENSLRLESRPTYKIVRGYQNSDIPKRTIKTGLTLAQAQAHCRDPETSSRTCMSAAGKARTRKYGSWFDGYEDEKRSRRRR